MISINTIIKPYNKLKMIFNKKILFVIICGIVFNCQTNKEVPKRKALILLGHYKGKHYNRYYYWIREFFYKEIYSVGSSLYLKLDSSYTYKSCGIILNGKFKVRNDTLVLFIHHYCYRKDTTKIYYYQPPYPEQFYKILNSRTLFWKEPLKIIKKNLDSLPEKIRDDYKKFYEKLESGKYYDCERLEYVE